MEEKLQEIHASMAKIVPGISPEEVIAILKLICDDVLPILENDVCPYVQKL